MRRVRTSSYLPTRGAPLPKFEASYIRTNTLHRSFAPRVRRKMLKLHRTCDPCSLVWTMDFPFKSTRKPDFGASHRYSPLWVPLDCLRSIHTANLAPTYPKIMPSNTWASDIKVVLSGVSRTPTGDPPNPPTPMPTFAVGS